MMKSRPTLLARVPVIWVLVVDVAALGNGTAKGV